MIKLVYAAANDGTNPDIKTLAIGTGISDVVDDTSPQLGGDLDTNGNIDILMMHMEFKMKMERTNYISNNIICSKSI